MRYPKYLINAFAILGVASFIFLACSAGETAMNEDPIENNGDNDGDNDGNNKSLRPRGATPLPPMIFTLPNQGGRWQCLSLAKTYLPERRNLLIPTSCWVCPSWRFGTTVCAVQTSSW